MDDTLKLAVEGYLQLKGDPKKGTYYDTIIDLMKVFKLSFSEASDFVIDHQNFNLEIIAEFIHIKRRQVGMSLLTAKRLAHTKNNHGQ